MFPRNIKFIAKCLEIFGFGIVGYSFRNESGNMIALQEQKNYVPGLPNYLRIIFPQDICTSERYNDTFIYHFHDKNDSYAELNLKEDKSDWQKAKPVERFYIKYEPKKTFQIMKLFLLTRYRSR